MCGGGPCAVHLRGVRQAVQLDSFTEIGNPRDMAKIFQSVEYAKWKSFRDSEDSRYVGLALPHILMRLPYGQGHRSDGIL